MIKCDQHFLEFKGNWAFHRTVNGTSQMNGHASFVPLQDTVPAYSYYEKGTHKEADLSFYREYIYCLTENGIEVYFASQKKKLDFFYTLNFDSHKKANAQHVCGNDRYEAYYTFMNEKKFSLAFNVKGPRKDFVIQTTFLKILNEPQQPYVFD